MKRILPLVVIVLLFSCKKENSTTTGTYFAKVKTIVQNHCIKCHSQFSGTHQGLPTSFDTDDQIVANYANIKATVADPVSPGPGGNKRMPQDDSLTTQQISDIVAWYNLGGKITD